jgi:sulfite exporter TauE/SafE
MRRIALHLYPHRVFSGRVLIYFLLRLIFSDLGVDEDDDRRLVRSFCRALVNITLLASSSPDALYFLRMHETTTTFD